jgi:hypothetical protein
VGFQSIQTHIDLDSTGDDEERLQSLNELPSVTGSSWPACNIHPAEVTEVFWVDPKTVTG